MTEHTPMTNEEVIEVLRSAHPPEDMPKAIDAAIKALELENSYEASQENKRQLVRRIDVIINGEKAAKQAALCDIVDDIQKLVNERDKALSVQGELVEALEPGLLLVVANLLDVLGDAEYAQLLRNISVTQSAALAKAGEADLVYIDMPLTEGIHEAINELVDKTCTLAKAESFGAPKPKAGVGDE